MTFCELTIFNDNPHWSDFVHNSTFYRSLSGFHRTFATGVACRQGTLTPQDTWSRPFGTCICSTCWDQSFSELVVIFPDYALRISLGSFSILLCHQLHYDLTYTIKMSQKVEANMARREWTSILLLFSGLKCTFVITRCPSSVRRPSVCPSVVNFSHFRLLLWNHWTEFNKTWQKARTQHLLPSLCFSGRSEKQDGHPGLWLAETFSTSPLKPMNGIQQNLTGNKISRSSTKSEFFGPIGKTRWPPWPLIGWDIFDFSSKTAGTIQRNLTGSKISTSSTKFVFFWADRKKQDGCPGLWLAETFSTSPLKPLNGIQQNLTGSKISTSSTKFVFFRPIGKTKWPPWPLIGWDIFNFCSETAEQNSTKLDWKQDLNVIYQVLCFCADRKNKMAALASDWLRYFRLLL